MTKTYTVSGQSKTRPTDLPDGFTVEETEGRFEASIGAEEDDAFYSVRVWDYVGTTFDLNIGFSVGGTLYEDSPLHMTRVQVAKLRNALNEWLGDVAVTADSPEPDRSTSYKDVDGDVWKFNDGGWLYYLQSNDREGCSRRPWVETIRTFAETFPWTRFV